MLGACRVTDLRRLASCTSRLLSALSSMVGSCPEKRMNTRQCRPALLASLIGLLIFVLAAVGDAQTKPLKILLTNDDGFDSSGLNVMRAALVSSERRPRSRRLRGAGPRGDAARAANMTSLADRDADPASAVRVHPHVHSAVTAPGTRTPVAGERTPTRRRRATRRPPSSRTPSARPIRGSRSRC